MLSLGGEKKTLLFSSIPHQFSLGSLVVTQAAVPGSDLGSPWCWVPGGIFTVNDPPGGPQMSIQSVSNWEFLLGN